MVRSTIKKQYMFHTSTITTIILYFVVKVRCYINCIFDEAWERCGAGAYGCDCNESVVGSIPILILSFLLSSNKSKARRWASAFRHSTQCLEKFSGKWGTLILTLGSLYTTVCGLQREAWFFFIFTLLHCKNYFYSCYIKVYFYYTKSFVVVILGAYLIRAWMGATVSSAVCID